MAWYRSATQTMTLPNLNGNGQVAQYITALTAICSEADFGWQVASTNTATNPNYIVLKRKNGAAGRIYLGSGVNPANCFYNPSAGTDSNMPVWGYDYSATVDTPTQSIASGPPFGGANGASWRGALINRNNRTIDIRGYWNAAEDIVVFVQTTSGSNLDAIFAVGKFLRDESGTLTMGMTTCGQGSMGAAWPPLSPTTAQSFGSTAVSNMCTWAYDPSTNSNAGGWLLLEQTTNTAVLNRGSYTADTTQYTNAGGIHVFYPINYVPTIGGYPWGFNRRAYASRFIAYGPPKTRDFEWLDNNSVSQGFYLGYTGTAATDRTCLSLINYDF